MSSDNFRNLKTYYPDHDAPFTPEYNSKAHLKSGLRGTFLFILIFCDHVKPNLISNFNYHYSDLLYLVNNVSVPQASQKIPAIKVWTLKIPLHLPHKTDEDGTYLKRKPWNIFLENIFKNWSNYVPRFILSTRVNQYHKIRLQIFDVLCKNVRQMC